MLHRIAQGEEIPTRFLQAVPKRDQFLPALDNNQPVVFQVAAELLGILQSKIGYVAISPHERMERLDVYNCGAALIPTINPYRAGFAQLNGDDPGSRIGTKKQRIFFKRHHSNRGKKRMRKTAK